MQDPVLSTTEVVKKAAEAGVRISGRQFRRWAAAGKVPAVQLPNGRFGFRWTEVEPLLARPVQVAS